MNSRRTYLIQWGGSCQRQCGFCRGTGFLSRGTRSSQDIERSFLKAKSGEYSHILLPCNSGSESFRNQLIENSLKQGFKSQVAIYVSEYASDLERSLQALEKKKIDVEILIVFENPRILTEDLLKKMEGFPKWDLLWVVQKSFCKSFAEIPKEIRGKIYFHFPYKLKLRDPFLTPREIYKFLKALQNGDPQWQVRALPGWDQFDARISEEMDLEPLLEPLIKAKVKNPRMSVVIPCYNGGEEVLLTLKYLAQQDYGFENFEVILVDDGSEDGTSERVLAWAQRHPQMNLSVFNLPRYVKKQAGEARFRAGIARNLGVKYAKGENLLFLDADILTPPWCLSQLSKELEQADLVQVQRIHLKSSAPLENLHFRDSDLTPWVYVPDQGYWEKFYREADKWMKLPQAWKYVCTYGLSLKKSLFKELGWFKKSFVFYGFEDTDLGYRAFKKNCQFKLSSLKVYHQFGEAENSEYLQNSGLRQSLLAKTAKVFFHHQLDPEIYESLRVYMGQERNLSYWLGSRESKRRSL